MNARLVLRPNRERSLKRHHPWVFSGGVAHVSGNPAPGETVLVCADDGTPLGSAAYSPSSQIRARMWTFDADTVVNDDLIVARVRAASERRSRLLARRTDSARIVFSEADELPGVIADRYGDTVVVQSTSAGADAWMPTVVDALASLPGIATVYERSDGDIREREGLERRVGLLRGPAPRPDLVAREHGFRFAVDVRSGHKTGFYLDQRHARHEVSERARGASVLNVFSYTGAFSVIAAASGARSLLSIDSSGPALETAKRNAVLNAVDIGELQEADAFTALRGLRDRGRDYDLIILDPPKLANSEAQLDKASRAYKDLNLLAMKLLAPHGTLLTFSCSGAMTMDLFQKVLAGAALDAKRNVRIVDRLHQPSDHPVPLWFPEAEYLKGAILTAD